MCTFFVWWQGSGGKWTRVCFSQVPPTIPAYTYETWGVIGNLPSPFPFWHSSEQLSSNLRARSRQAYTLQRARWHWYSLNQIRYQVVNCANDDVSARVVQSTDTNLQGKHYLETSNYSQYLCLTHTVRPIAFISAVQWVHRVTSKKNWNTTVKTTEIDPWRL